MKRYLYQAGLAVFGLALCSITIFANRLRLAHNTDWGSGRIVLLIVGISILGMSFFASAFKEQKVYIFTTSSLLLVLGVYIFLISNGRWIDLPGSSQHYDELATAFRSGHLYLDVQPPAALAALPDPYDPQARKNNPVLAAFIEDHAWDLSYYHDRFYMYWGPAPALLLAIVKVFYAGTVGDQVLAFIFGWGALIFQTLLLVRVWLRCFPHLPAWTVSLGVTTVGLIVATVWMFNMPRIYQAAIFSCQLFLLAGIYFVFSALDLAAVRTGTLWAAGILWALAIASRATLLGSVLFLIFLVIFLLVRKFHQASDRAALLSGLAAIVIPVVITLAALGWYNVARFGSVLEFGLRYQLTLSNFNQIYSQVFSLKYILPNLYNYFILPFLTQAHFPFIKAQHGVVPQILAGPGLAYYQTEEITGILFSAPFLLFIFWPVISLIRFLFRTGTGMQPAEGGLDDPDSFYRWTSAFLLSASIISFSTLLVTFYVTMRYMADFTFTLTPLAVMGFWQGLSRQKPGVMKNFFSVSGLLLSWLSIGISLLLVIGYSRVLQNLFFSLFRHIPGFFRWF